MLSYMPTITSTDNNGRLKMAAREPILIPVCITVLSIGIYFVCYTCVCNYIFHKRGLIS